MMHLQATWMYKKIKNTDAVRGVDKCLLGSEYFLRFRFPAFKLKSVAAESR